MSSKIKKFTGMNIRQIQGGKDPERMIQEFIIRQGFDPDECAKERSPDMARWMVSVGNGEDLEILLEGIRRSSETTVYMGVNIATIPVRGAMEMLSAALEIADGLVGIKVSLVGHYLVLSSTLGAAGVDVDDLDYHYRLIVAQQVWFKEALADELGWESVPEE